MRDEFLLGVFSASYDSVSNNYAELRVLNDRLLRCREMNYFAVKNG